ncbi:uncharacterized protein LOC119174290 [Rhipicephalus microplus]|uniref:uncharacterized protein LOC119174290 n=1 Tax=Rhipicephalus microplus TaxID=6941 RepID=UPI003F6B11F7
MASNNNVRVNPGDAGTSKHESFRDDGVGPPLSPHSSRDNQAPPPYLECMRGVATLAERRARWVIPVETTEYTYGSLFSSSRRTRPGDPDSDDSAASGPQSAGVGPLLSANPGEESKFLSGRLLLEQSARPSGLRHGPQRHAEATYALIEALYDRDTAIKNRRLQLEEDRLRFEIKRHEQKMKLKEMELQQRQAEQEAKFKLRRQELEALAEERRHNRAYQHAQLEIIKLLINK